MVLYAECYPCSWGPTLSYWDSQVLSDPALQSMIHTTTFLSPPVRTFLKAGFSGNTMLKKTVLVHVSNRLEGLPPLPPGIDGKKLFAEWRQSVIPNFIRVPKLYVECPRPDAPQYLRVLNTLALRFNLQINGGGRQHYSRSFADTGMDKRVRYFLTRGPGCDRTDEDLAEGVSRGIHEALLTPMVGWESLFEMPEEALIIYANSSVYLYDVGINSIILQMVLVSKARAIVTLKSNKTARDLERACVDYNVDHQGSQIRKICSATRLLFNLAKSRLTPAPTYRPRDLPPARVGDLAAQFSDLPLGVLADRLKVFLDAAECNMYARGFGAAPTRYVKPRLILQKNRVGAVTGDRFWLSWDEPEHAHLFFTLWNGFHWADAEGAQVHVLSLKNDQWEATERRAPGRLLGDRAHVLPNHWQTYLQNATIVGGAEACPSEAAGGAPGILLVAHNASS